MSFHHTSSSRRSAMPSRERPDADDANFLVVPDDLEVDAEWTVGHRAVHGGVASTTNVRLLSQRLFQAVSSLSNCSSVCSPKPRSGELVDGGRSPLQSVIH